MKSYACANSNSGNDGNARHWASVDFVFPVRGYIKIDFRDSFCPGLFFLSFSVFPFLLVVSVLVLPCVLLLSISFCLCFLFLAIFFALCCFLALSLLFLVSSSLYSFPCFLFLALSFPCVLASFSLLALSLRSACISFSFYGETRLCKAHCPHPGEVIYLTYLIFLWFFFFLL